MAELLVEGNDLWIRLSSAEVFWGFHRSFQVPLSCVRGVRTSPAPWTELRGWRSAGTAFTGKIALGTRRHGTGYDFTAMYGRHPVVVVELAGPRYERLAVSTDDPEGLVGRIAEAAGIEPQ